MNAVGQPAAARDGTRATPLEVPREIGFLSRYGLRAADLAWAAAMADRTGVTPDEWVIKEGLMSEESFYRALAEDLKLPFLEAPRLGMLTAFPRCIETAVAPLDAESGYVVAPQGLQLSRLLELGPLRPDGLSVTSPSILREAVLEHCAASVAEAAAEELQRRRPEYAFPRRDFSKSLVMAGAVVLAGAAAVWFAPQTVPLLAGFLLGIGFLCMVILRLLAVAHPAAVSDPSPPRVHDGVLPVYTVIVALHREGRVVPQLVEALKSLDYPAAKLDIKLVIEKDDRETADALARVPLPAWMHVIVAPPGEPRTKPRALNVALPLARGVFTVVYDAEDQPDPEQLRAAVSLFRSLPKNVACLQARLAIRDRHNWLTRLFAIEYAALFDVINPGLIASGVPLPLGGTSNHFRTAALRDLVGWDAWNVTEDADLGIRLARLGYAVHDLPSSTWEEAPATLPQWIRQRARWMKGFMQTCITHTRHPLRVLRQLGPNGFFGALTMTFGTVISALVYPFFTAAFLIGVWNGSAFRMETPLDFAWSLMSCVLFGAGSAAILAPAVVGVARRGWWPLLAYVPLLPFYYALISFAAWRGLGELIWKTYHWNKTDHGLRPLKGASAGPPPLVRAGA